MNRTQTWLMWKYSNSSHSVRLSVQRSGINWLNWKSMWIVWMMPVDKSTHPIQIQMWHIVYSKRMPLHLIGSYWFVATNELKLCSTAYYCFIYREFGSHTNNYQCHGAIINKNKIEDFKTCDKLELINEEGKLIWDDITSGACLEKPSLLSRFFILSFGVSDVNSSSLLPGWLKY